MSVESGRSMGYFLNIGAQEAANSLLDDFLALFNHVSRSRRDSLSRYARNNQLLSHNREQLANCLQIFMLIVPFFNKDERNEIKLSEYFPRNIFRRFLSSHTDKEINNRAMRVIPRARERKREYNFRLNWNEVYPAFTIKRFRATGEIGPAIHPLNIKAPRVSLLKTAAAAPRARVPEKSTTREEPCLSPTEKRAPINYPR